jgi:hypothetical protein
MTNFYKRTAVLLVMLGIMITVWVLDPNFYSTVMMGIGGWQVGTWSSNWARERWPN